MSHFFAADCLSLLWKCECPQDRDGVLFNSLLRTQYRSWSWISQPFTAWQRLCWAYTQPIVFSCHNDTGMTKFELRNAWAFKPQLMLFFGVKVRMIYFMEVPEMLSICLNHRGNLLAHAIKKFRGRAGFKHESVLVLPQIKNLCL